MRTGFTERQMADPRIRAADDILRKCVHCGFCAPACPTYRLTGDELDGPRGRIWLIRDLLESGTSDAAPPADPGVTDHLDRCLGCLACMPACPSGVDYHGLIGIARGVVEERAFRGPLDRLYRALLGRVLPNPHAFGLLFRTARLLAPMAGLLRGRAAAGLALARAARPVASRPRQARDDAAPKAPRRGRVALVPGCAQSVMAPGINAALARILARAGYEPVMLKGARCCGALNEHLGQAAAARKHAKAVITAILAEADGPGLEAVVLTASGCGTLMKTYGALFAGDDEWAPRARRAAGLVRDAGEFLEACGLSFTGLSPRLCL
ncbi:MAG TPA: 4Fe-4S dicluster domain-containing protein, partial [Alphaproteobacteria bacterium]|nr:4Fe-4S dicluster domain-containing protein [Alphaproteobacteria bacterium]